MEIKEIKKSEMKFMGKKEIECPQGANPLYKHKIVEVYEEDENGMPINDTVIGVIHAYYTGYKYPDGRIHQVLLGIE